MQRLIKLSAVLLTISIFTTVGFAQAVDVDALYSFSGTKLLATEASLGRTQLPEMAYSSGSWSIRDASSWISGFYSGCLWQMYAYTGDTSWLQLALTRNAALNGQEYNASNHDVGFRIFNSYGQGYRNLPPTDPTAIDYKNRILIAADTLASRYNPAYEAIESWDGDRVIIDNMMNLELLLWASENGSSNAATLRDIAHKHSMTTIAQHLRPDGSSYHVVEFNPDGTVDSKYTHQGYADWSTWSRGQAWGLYGFTVVYRYFGEQQFLDAAIAMSDYFVDNLPASGVPPYDFDAPSAPLDSSAGSIAASGLLELSTLTTGVLSDKYFNAAEQILTGLSQEPVLTTSSLYPSILSEGSRRKGEHYLGLIYGDYYLLEALARYDELTELPGDTDLDGDVDISDFLILKSNYGTTTGAHWTDGDFDGDGDVDISDFLILKSNYGT